MGKGHWTKEGWLSPKFLTAIIVALFFGVALYLRVALPYDQVFSGDWIKFTSVDAYYHMRLVDNLVHNFPHHMSVNPYFIYPSSPGAMGFHFFDWLLASIIWVIGLGSPTQHIIDVVGVYFPAVLGALTVISVYFIGKELFGRWAGVLSAGLIAVLPGEFLGRSILGFTDHHVAETLFTTVTILFLILAIKAARQRQLTFNHLRHQDWARGTKPIIYSLLAGIFLGVYLLTWLGALLFVFIISVYFIIQFIIDHLKHKSTDYLCLVGVILFFVALMIFLPVSPGRLYLVSLVIALLIPPVSSGVSRLMALREIRPAYYPLILFGLGLAGLAIFYAINPSLLKTMLGQFSIFTPSEVARTTIEMQPLLFPHGNFSLSVAWANFTTGFFLSLISLGILIYLVIKQGSAEKSLLVVWSLIILAAILGQRRFGYYFAVNVSLLTGYLSVLVYYVVRFIIDYLRGKSTDYMSWRILEFAGFKELITRPVELPTRVERKRAKLKKGREAGIRPTITHVSISLWVIVVFFLVFFPNIGPAKTTASQPPFAPSDAWYSSLTWLKQNTPDPFDNPDFYYELTEPPPPGESYNYPESAYGVMAWWDYGYWITRIAHRLPNANPSQDPRAVTSVASFFTAPNENSANEIMQEMDSLYVIIDYQTATSKFWAIVTWVGKEKTEFFDVYQLPQEGKLRPVTLFYPEYYRSLSTRLYNFDGKAVTPESSTVISYQEKVSREGKLYREITSVEQFASYEAAEAYLLSHESANYKIVGNNPFISPVPLEALQHYRLIHGSDSSVMLPDVGMVPEVKIFEYIE